MAENNGTKDRFGYDQPNHDRAVDAHAPKPSIVAKILKGKGK